MPTRTVVFDRIGYATGEELDDPLVPGRKIEAKAFAYKGDTIELTSSEASRLDALGATVGADEHVEPPTPPASDSPLRPPDLDEVGKVAGLDDRSDTELPPTPTIDAQAVTEAGMAAGVDNPGGTGVELHDNERTANGLPGLSKFLAPSSAAAEAEAAPTASDDELRAMKAEELVAYLTQHNGEVDRVEVIEAERDKPRVTVTKAIDAIRTAPEGGTSSTTPEE